MLAMLKVARLKNPEDKRSLFAAFNPDTDVWVVSDLRTKLELQKELMKDRPGMPGDAILRGSELWTQLLKKYLPKALVVSKDWIQLFARTALGESLSPSDLKISVELLSVLGSVFAHPDRDSILQDLLARDASAITRWGKVLAESTFLFDQARSRGWIQQDSLAAVLTEFKDLSLRHPRQGEGQIYFDLGASLGASEAELIRRLALNHDVTVLLPRPANAENFNFLLQPGESLEGESVGGFAEATANQLSEKVYRRFSGRTAEIKNAVAQVRAWLDAGVSIDKIAVITPNFEMDFPVLAMIFQVEGISLDRELSERIQTHRSLQKWSSKLRLWKEDLEYADLVTAFQEGFPLRSEDFEAQLKSGLFHQDLERISAVNDQVKAWKPNDSATDLSGFFEKATRLWVDTDFSDLERIFESLNEKTPRGAQLSTRDWIEWMEVQTARLESTKSKAGAERLSIVPLQSADSLQWTHRIFLSLVDQLPDRGGTSLLNRDELDVLGWTHGFFLPHPEQKLLQFELEWSLLIRTQVDILSYPLTDWDGAPTSPQALWLSGRQETGHEADLPLVTRWDELQKTKSPVAGLTSSQAAPLSIELVPQMNSLKLSSSSVQKYGDCPFMFAAEKVLGLVDPPLVDMDMDRRQMGQLQHDFLEQLTREPIRWQRTPEELGEILENLAIESKDPIRTRQPSLWRAQKTKWIALGLRFLSTEEKWFQKFPNSRILAREHEFRFVYDPQSQVWRPGERTQDSDVQFTGRLDRVDGYFEGDQLKSLVLYDYKASLQSKHSFSQWSKDNEIQLGFYSWAMNQGLMEADWAGKVVGAIYYNLKNLTREKGYWLDEAVGTIATRSLPKNFARPALEEYWTGLQLNVEERIRSIQQGRFSPQPLKLENCDRCKWKGLCRAPHLM